MPVASGRVSIPYRHVVQFREHGLPCELEDRIVSIAYVRLLPVAMLDKSDAISQVTYIFGTCILRNSMCPNRCWIVGEPMEFVIFHVKTTEF